MLRGAMLVRCYAAWCYARRPEFCSCAIDARVSLLFRAPRRRGLQRVAPCLIFGYPLLSRRGRRGSPCSNEAPRRGRWRVWEWSWVHFCVRVVCDRGRLRKWKQMGEPQRRSVQSSFKSFVLLLLDFNLRLPGKGFLCECAGRVRMWGRGTRLTGGTHAGGTR